MVKICFPRLLRRPTHLHCILKLGDSVDAGGDVFWNRMFQKPGIKVDALQRAFVSSDNLLGSKPYQWIADTKCSPDST